MKSLSLVKKMGLLLSAVIFLLPITAQAESDQIAVDTQPVMKVELTQQGISQRLDEIADKYPVGIYLSEEDAQFVKTYAKKASEPSTLIQPFALNTGYFAGEFGNVTLEGWVSVNIGFINNSIEGSITVRDAKQIYHKSLGSAVELRAWGAFGEGGTNIGLVYNKDYTNPGSNVNNNRNVFSDTFVASVAYYTCEIKGLVDGNSFGTTKTN